MGGACGSPGSYQRDDNQAIVAMVDSNLQRENLKPSEKAFAYASLTLLFFCNR